SSNLWIEVSHTSDLRIRLAIRKRRARVVGRVRVSVVERQGDALVVEIAGSRLQVQAVVVAIAVRAAYVDGCELRVETIRISRGLRTGHIWVGRVRRSIPLVHLSVVAAVVVGDGVV